jgi:tetratricopeptide (TPR) repeat protein
MTNEYARELIDDGIRAERLGAIDRALTCFAEAASDAAEPDTLAEALTRLADAHRARSEWAPALDAARRAQATARAAHLTDRLACAFVAEGNVLICRGQFNEAKHLFEQLLTTTADPRLRGIALQNIGSILAQQGQLGAAERSFAESYGCFQRAEYRRGEAIALNNYGRVALDRGDAALAEGLLSQGLAIARDVEDEDLVALVTLNLAEALAARGHHQRAGDLASEALGHFAECGNRWRQVECLRLIGTINERAGDRDDAIRCYERGLQLAEQIETVAEIRSLRDCLTRARTQRC